MKTIKHLQNITNLTILKHTHVSKLNAKHNNVSKTIK
jgi:hypothetical protein